MDQDSVENGDWLAEEEPTTDLFEEDLSIRESLSAVASYYRILWTHIWGPSGRFFRRIALGVTLFLAVASPLTFWALEGQQGVPIRHLILAAVIPISTLVIGVLIWHLISAPARFSRAQNRLIGLLMQGHIDLQAEVDELKEGKDKREEGAKQLQEVNKKFLGHQMWSATHILLPLIEENARETIASHEKVSSMPPAVKEKYIEDVILSRWKSLQSQVGEWDDQTEALVERLYGVEARLLYESDVGIPPQESPDFDTSRAGLEAGLYLNVQKRVWRVNQLIEKRLS